MNRAEQFGRRKQIVETAGSDRIYTVTSALEGADESRGIRGTAVFHTVELTPAPLVRDVTVEMVSRLDGVVQEGDRYIEVLGMLLTNEVMGDPTLQIKVGTELHSVIHYEKADYAGATIYWRIYIRGVGKI